MSKIIELKNVNKWFDKFQALKDVSLEVNQQEKIVICGPSGSGKSTLIRCINRLEEHQDGTIIVDGKEISENTKDLEKIRAEREILILEEQYSIAKDLGLEGSSFDISKGEKYIITEGSSYVTKTSTSSIKDYERGYKAIAKEIEFLKKRSDKDMIKRSVDYITISREISNTSIDRFSYPLKSIQTMMPSFRDGSEFKQCISFRDLICVFARVFMPSMPFMPCPSVHAMPCHAENFSCFLRMA